ncbi:type VII secretion target [Amycolatopsis sacchari]|uniref:type VII secretion target n=1 Tax=Amycolatopsis sacchari TaxID=115433 RepID=UPI003EB790C1
MAEGYEVLTDELTTHAGKVDALADRLSTAVQAAQQVSMDNSAYGVICQPFALLLDPFEQLGVRALQSAQESVADTATKVRDTVQTYEGQDQTTGDAIKTLGEPLNG